MLIPSARIPTSLRGITFPAEAGCQTNRSVVSSMQLAPVSVIIPTRNRPPVMPSEVVIVYQSSDEESIHAVEQEFQKVSLPMEMRGQRTNAEMAITASAGPDRGTTNGQS